MPEEARYKTVQQTIEVARSFRFFVISAILHAVIFLVLALWSLPTVVSIIVSQVQEADPLSQPFHNRQEMPEDGEAMWERLADVQAIDHSLVVSRQQDSVAEPSPPNEFLRPTVSLDQASRMSPSELITVSPAPPAPRLARPAMSERKTASPEAVADLEDLQALVPLAVPERMSVPIEDEIAAAQRELTMDQVPEPPPVKLDDPRQPDRVADLAGAATDPPKVSPESVPRTSLPAVAEQLIGSDVERIELRPVDDMIPLAQDTNLPRSEIERAEIELPSISAPVLKNRAQDRELLREMPQPTLDSNPERPEVMTRVSSELSDVDEIRELFSLRDPELRNEFIVLFGGSPESESAVQRGLQWLATHQNQDGSWSLHEFHKNCEGKHDRCGGAGNVQSNTAASGLALLPFLAAGYHHKAGEFQAVIAKGLGWLKSQQKEDGDLMPAGGQHHLYSHSIATIALCEAYGMTSDAELEGPVRKALEFIVKAQHPPSGGWRYKPREGGDTSVVGWAMMALKSGEMAGIATNPQTMELAKKWLTSVEGNQPIGGRFGYQNRSPSPAMSAEGLLCLQFLGVQRNSARMLAGGDYLLDNLPTPGQGGNSNSYYWYYGTQVMYHLQGEYWKQWNDRLRDHLVTTQKAEGPTAGTWDPIDNYEKRGGRIYATSLKLLMLEVYYRHLPLFEQLEN